MGGGKMVLTAEEWLMNGLISLYELVRMAGDNIQCGNTK